MLKKFVRSTAADDAFGIEVELEGMHQLCEILDNDGTYNVDGTWKCIRDGSLRNSGVELVTRGGIPHRMLGTAFSALEDIVSSTYRVEGYECDAENSMTISPRTSTHVHVSALGMEYYQILGMLVLSAAWEPLLQTKVQEDRRRNLFCLPMLLCSSHLSATLRRSLMYYDNGSEVDAFHALTDFGKYSSVNPGRLIDLGTIEYRSMGGWPGKAAMLEWCDILHRIREFCRTLRDLSSVFDALAMSRCAVEELLFGAGAQVDTSSSYMPFSRAVRTAHMVLSAAKSHEKIEDPFSTLEYFHPDTGTRVGQVAWEAFHEYRLPPRPIVEEVLRSGTAGTAFGITSTPEYIEFTAVGAARSFKVRMKRPAQATENFVEVVLPLEVA